PPNHPPRRPHPLTPPRHPQARAAPILLGYWSARPPIATPQFFMIDALVRPQAHHRQNLETRQGLEHTLSLPAGEPAGPGDLACTGNRLPARPGWVSVDGAATVRVRRVR